MMGRIGQLDHEEPRFNPSICPILQRLWSDTPWTRYPFLRKGHRILVAEDNMVNQKVVSLGSARK